MSYVWTQIFLLLLCFTYAALTQNNTLKAKQNASKNTPNGSNGSTSHDIKVIESIYSSTWDSDRIVKHNNATKSAAEGNATLAQSPKTSEELSNDKERSNINIKPKTKKKKKKTKRKKKKPKTNDEKEVKPMDVRNDNENQTETENISEESKTSVQNSTKTNTTVDAIKSNATDIDVMDESLKTQPSELKQLAINGTDETEPAETAFILHGGHGGHGGGHGGGGGGKGHSSKKSGSYSGSEKHSEGHYGGLYGFYLVVVAFKSINQCTR